MNASIYFLKLNFVLSKLNEVINFTGFFNHHHFCAGLNPLSRTIQGNDPGTTACPPSGVWHWVTPLQDTEFHKPT